MVGKNELGLSLLCRLRLSDPDEKNLNFAKETLLYCCNPAKNIVFVAKKEVRSLAGFGREIRN